MKISFLPHVPYFCEGVHFRRGSQSISDEQLKKLMRNPFFNSRLRKGDFLIENLEGIKEQHVPSVSLDADAEKAKLEAIRNAPDEKAVKELVKKETSKELLAEAEKRLEFLDDNDKKMKEKRSGLKKAKEEAEKDEFKREAFEQK